ncbi:MAG: CBS domain-containing protein [Candidatus Aenigmarchaeota archaeon]|nr:CBS domain-containing protein [Candidatus Aenigmarchaeota archaeon]NIQ18108.1 CBS domain-containing protein [Candidatus Aenigmarchaeota archaeon]
MLVKEIMTKDVKTIEPSITVKEAAQKMVEENTKFLIVIKKGKLVGITTEWDFVKKVVAEGETSSKIKIKDIMTSDVIVIGPDTEIGEAASIMAEHNIKKLPIVTENVLIGVVTAMDILAAEPKLMEKISELILMTKKSKPVAG